MHRSLISIFSLRIADFVTEFNHFYYFFNLQILPELRILLNFVLNFYQHLLGFSQNAAIFIVSIFHYAVSSQVQGTAKVTLVDNSEKFEIQI